MQKAVFLDRDGTINVDKDYLFKIEEFEFLQGAVQALKRLCDEGFLLFVVTNQSGIARGFFGEAEYRRLTDWMLSELEGRGVHISAVYFCPHLADAKIEKYRVDCECRKPKLGMFMRAVREFDIDLSKSFAVGDKERDVEIAKTTDIRGIQIYSDSESKSGNLYRIKGGLDKASDLILKLDGGNYA